MSLGHRHFGKETRTYAFFVCFSILWLHIIKTVHRVHSFVFLHKCSIKAIYICMTSQLGRSPSTHSLWSGRASADCLNSERASRTSRGTERKLTQSPHICIWHRLGTGLRCILFVFIWIRTNVRFPWLQAARMLDDQLFGASGCRVTAGASRSVSAHGGLGPLLTFWQSARRHACSPGRNNHFMFSSQQCPPPVIKTFPHAKWGLKISILKILNYLSSVCFFAQEITISDVFWILS